MDVSNHPFTARLRAIFHRESQAHTLLSALSDTVLDVVFNAVLVAVLDAVLDAVSVCTWYVVDSTVDDDGSLLHPLSSHHLCSARPHNQDISTAHLCLDRKRIIKQTGNKSDGQETHHQTVSFFTAFENILLIIKPKVIIIISVEVRDVTCSGRSFVFE